MMPPALARSANSHPKTDDPNVRHTTVLKGLNTRPAYSFRVAFRVATGAASTPPAPQRPNPNAPTTPAVAH